LFVCSIEWFLYYECVLLREGHPRVFPNLRRTCEYRKLLLHKQLSFDFLASFPFRRKEIFPWEYRNIENKKEVVYIRFD
jgi:hypothetical protein